MTTGSKSQRVGDFVFDDDFESGNLGEVKHTSDFEYEIALRPDTNAPRFRLWFYFRVRPLVMDQRAVFSIVNFSKQRTLYRDGMTPVVRSTSRPKWERVPTNNVFCYKSAKHKAAFVMTFAFVFDRTEEDYFFAYSFPFTYTDQQRLLAALEDENLSYVRRTLLCRSIQGRRVDMLTIGDRYNPGICPKSRSTVVVVARVHPGETPASYVARGLIDFLCSSEREAVQLRREVTFIIVPMLNPDGVFVGNYRTCALGIDHNRRWDRPLREMEPSLLAVKEYVHELYRDENIQLDFFIDIHAHSTARSSFVLCNPHVGGHSSSRRASLGGFVSARRGSVSGDAISSWPKAVAVNAREFSLAACKYCTDPNKSCTGRRVLGNELTGVHCFTLEMSFFATTAGTHAFGSRSSSLGGDYRDPNSDDGYIEFGRQVGFSFMDHYGIPRDKFIRAKDRSNHHPFGGGGGADSCAQPSHICNRY